MMRNLTVLLIAATAMLWCGCDKEPPVFYSGLGKRPVYLPLDSLNDIRNLPPQDVVLSGPIYWRDSLFFMLEERKGIHVFLVKDSTSSAALTFLKIPAVSGFTISDNRLYADSWRDLVTIDISNIMAIQPLSRNTGVVQPLLYPPLYSGIFECIDESKGAVIGWEDLMLTDVKCMTQN